jgi:hypothetical protein
MDTLHILLQYFGRSFVFMGTLLLFYFVFPYLFRISVSHGQRTKFHWQRSHRFKSERFRV